MNLSLTELAKELVEVTQEYNLIYDPCVLPVKIGPDCYLVYATQRTGQCTDKGECKVEQYYALTGGKTIKITNGAL